MSTTAAASRSLRLGRSTTSLICASSSRPLPVCHVSNSSKAILLSSRACSLYGRSRTFSPVVSAPRCVFPCTVRCASVEDAEEEKQLINEDASERMEKSLESVRANFNSVRTGRASPSLLDRIEVEYYGANVSLKSMAQVTTPDASTILITPFDKSSLASIEKAIQKSDIGMNPSNDGSVIRLSVPQLTAERRKEMLKVVSKLAEEGKVALRNVRRDAIKAFEKMDKDKKMSSDGAKDASAKIQKMTDDYVGKVETLTKQKEKELATI